MIFKEGVDQLVLTKEGMAIALAADEVHKEMLDGKEVVITETNCVKHRVERSAHYRGDAIDIRIWYTDAKKITISFLATLRERLGPDYVLILEHNHIHAHWAPVWHEEKA